MNIPNQIIKQIINDEINLKSFNENELREWLISNLINVLCDNKIFATKVKSTPIKKPQYTYLFEVSANYKGTEHHIELGILNQINLKIENIFKENSNRVSVCFFDNISEIQSLLKSINEFNYYITKIENTGTLIIN